MVRKRKPGNLPDPGDGDDDGNPWDGQAPGTILFADGAGGCMAVPPPDSTYTQPVLGFVAGKPAWIDLADVISRLK